ncbi:MAG: UDP-3-O-acyl-N-acetylglucosamine deacetylase [Deltaproteobacteria bacterium]|nr:UDP-3-O-acyl-N-acetylglucosamine deacetylase [Deltaproteobacteria bacterium]
MHQTTIDKIIGFSGIGLHTGDFVKCKMIPSCADSGIRFVRTDLPGRPQIKANSKHVVSTSYATTIGRKGVTISTVEHLMSAFVGLGVDNVTVEINGGEVPALDGSAAGFVELIEDAGIKRLDAVRKYILIKKPVKVRDGDRFVNILPLHENAELLSTPKFTIDYTMDFTHPYLDNQAFSLTVTKDSFKKGVASARTYGFLKDVEMLRANGLARGGSLDNAIVVGDNEILNEDGLRYDNEFVRHKVLDVIGDLSLIGYPIIGRIQAHRSGHDLNQALVAKTLKSLKCWEVIDMTEEVESKFAPIFTEELATA